MGKTKEKKYKDTVFRMLFGEDKEALLSLYNALNHTNYNNLDELEINTLESAIYIGVKNDISFILSDILNLYEHQSSVNPNMPLRFLRYLSDIYKDIVTGSDIYSTKLIMLPTPKFVVFYNGTRLQEERYVYNLSDAYIKKQDKYQLELSVDVYNINPNNNEELKRACKLLDEYTIFVETVREKYKKCKNIRTSLKETVEECIMNDILRVFLTTHKEEVIDMDWLYEYDEEAYIKDMQDEWIQEGVRQGINTVLINALKSGSSPKTISEVNSIPIEEVLEIQRNMLRN